MLYLTIFFSYKKANNVKLYAERRNWSSHQRFSVRKGVLRNFAKFTWKQLCQSLFFNKVAGLEHLFYITRPGDCFWSSHREVFIKKVFFNIFTEFAAKKDLCWCLFWINVVDLQSAACNFIKERLQHRCFSLNFEKFWKTLFS